MIYLHQVLLDHDNGCVLCSCLAALPANLGYREKVFAIIGVKVYAAGLYVNDSVFSRLDAWRGHSAAAIQQDTSLFNMIFEGKRVMFNCLDYWDGRRPYQLKLI